MHGSLRVIRNPQETPNLFDSLALAESYIDEDFVWTAASIFFTSLSDLRQLINSHRGSFMSAIAQNQTRYKPKLKFSASGALEAFVVGDAQHQYSSPTFFVANKKIFSYVRKYDETEVVQKAIDFGEKFNTIFSNNWSRAIQLPEDYLAVQKQLLGKYVSQNSRLRSCKVGENVFAYNSTLTNCELSNCILIDVNTDSTLIENCIMFSENGNKLNLSN